MKGIEMKLIIAVVVLILVSCGGGEAEETSALSGTAPDESAAEVAIDEGVDKVEALVDSIIHVTAGNDFSISLDTNPTTGYHWELRQIEQREIIVEQSGDPEYTPDDHEDGMVGVGGTEVWQFHSIAAGEAVLHFVYCPPGATVGDVTGNTNTVRIISE